MQHTRLANSSDISSSVLNSSTNINKTTFSEFLYFAPALLFSAFILKRFSKKTFQRKSVKSQRKSKLGPYDYDLVIIGAGVGGHAAAIEARTRGLKVAIVECNVMGGTCVNRGCVPSKALLAGGARARHIRKFSERDIDDQEKQQISNEAVGLASAIRNALTNSMVQHGIDVIRGFGTVIDEHTVGTTVIGRIDQDRTLSTSHIMVAPGSKPRGIPGVTIDNEYIFDSDVATQLPWVPKKIVIIGSGYIGLEFVEVYNALGSEVTILEAAPQLMAGVDNDIRGPAVRALLSDRNIETQTSVFAKATRVEENGKVSVRVDITDAETKESLEPLMVDAVLLAVGRVPTVSNMGLQSLGVEINKAGFCATDEQCRVKKTDGSVIESITCVGDANGKYMLAHAASAQAKAIIDTVMGTPRFIDHEAVPAACFTHPEVAFVGITEEQARERGEQNGFEVGVSKTYFKANTKALAAKDAAGLGKLIYRKDNGQILGMHLFGLHSSDLVHEAAIAMTLQIPVEQMRLVTHAHPTVSEVCEELFTKAAHDMIKSRELDESSESE